MSPIKPENKKRYPKDWKQISDEVRRRAGFRCECAGECGHDHEGRCGLEHNTIAAGRKVDEFGIPVYYTVILTVAHYPEHDPANCNDDNLTAMCQPCHLRLDAPRKARERREKATAGMTPLFEAGRA